VSVDVEATALAFARLFASSAASEHGGSGRRRVCEEYDWVVIMAVRRVVGTTGAIRRNRVNWDGFTFPPEM